MNSLIRPVRRAVFISGAGSTLQALLDSQENASIDLVICSRKSALGALKARRSGVPVHFFSKQDSFDHLQKVLLKHRIQKIFLAGFMKILPADFVNFWQNNIYNIHPSLLPAYKGLHALENSYNAQSAMGVSIHHVSPGVDEGPVILQQTVLSSSATKVLSFDEAHLWMRAAEQSLIRDFASRGYLHV